MNYDLKELQSAEYEILKEIVTFCKDNNITYFLMSGTLLGAVRHGGFIPWDDDIDIAMDYQNFHRFLKLAKKSFPPQYFVQHYTTDKNYPNPWIKIRKNNTTFMDTSLSNLDIHFGINVDIFLLNGISDNKVYHNIQILSSKIMNMLLYKHLLKAQKVQFTTKQVLAYRLMPERIRVALIKALDHICSIEITKCKNCYSDFYLCGEAVILKSCWFMDLIPMRFHNDTFMVPSNYEDILTAIYGDWQKLPPESKRIGHGDLIVDFENSYKLYYSGKGSDVN